MIVYTRAQSKQDLEGILDLQKANLPARLSAAEMQSQGFVTVVHSLEDLTTLNVIAPHIIAKQNNQVVAYILAMTAASKAAIPVLKPMFELFDSIAIEGRPIAGYNFIVVGQACVDKAYRGTGILEGCYAAYKTAFEPDYHMAVTEIATANTRSLRAHERIGFVPVHTYAAPAYDSPEWQIVVWKWR